MCFVILLHATLFFSLCYTVGRLDDAGPGKHSAALPQLARATLHDQCAQRHARDAGASTCTRRRRQPQLGLQSRRRATFDWSHRATFNRTPAAMPRKGKTTKHTAKEIQVRAPFQHAFALGRPSKFRPRLAPFDTHAMPHAVRTSRGSDWPGQD